MRYPLRHPTMKITIEIPYEDYKKLVELKGKRTWREALYDWAGITKEVKR